MLRHIGPSTPPPPPQKGVNHGSEDGGGRDAARRLRRVGGADKHHPSDPLTSEHVQDTNKTRGYKITGRVEDASVAKSVEAAFDRDSSLSVAAGSGTGEADCQTAWLRRVVLNSMIERGL